MMVRDTAREVKYEEQADYKGVMKVHDHKDNEKRNENEDVR